jgi:hypothetical protein
MKTILSIFLISNCFTGYSQIMLPVYQGAFSRKTPAVTTVTSTTGKIWMDRNLGATQVATSSNDALSYGDLYQWGRGSDGHQIRTPLSGETTTISSTDTPGNTNFIKVSSSPYDWRSGQNANLWQGVNGINNPCPTGYRLPTETELNAERNNGGTGFWGTGSAQNNAAGAFASVLKLPVAGARGNSSGLLGNVGIRGDYWSSTVDGTGAKTLSFEGGLNFFTNGRAFGFSVRCIKGEESSGGTAVVSSYFSASSAGIMIAGTAVTSVTQTITATVTQVGDYSITATANGVTFAATGAFAGTGAQSIVLTATGTPSAVGSNNFILNTSINLTFSRTTAGSVTSATGKIWMDRNLGATRVATSSTDHLAYGSLYQWGRGTDGHQSISWTGPTAGTAVNGLTTTLSSTDTPGNTNFIKVSSSPHDWRSGQNANLWQGVSGINNPCPSGYRLPTRLELNAERALFTTQNAAGAFASILKLPVAGYRSNSDGSFNFVGGSGYYWSSTVSDSLARSLIFNSGGAFMFSNGRAHGFSVRCIKGEESSGGTAVVSSYVSASSAGTMIAGTAVTDVTQTITATVTQVGDYSITATANGVTFAGSGTFTVTGAQAIVLTATGTPTTAAGSPFSYALNTTPSCSFNRTVAGVGDVISTTGKIWMDRNLGATQVATSSTDHLSYGSLYQWGRGNDGHQLINYSDAFTGASVNGITTTLSTGDAPGNNLFINGQNNWRTEQNDNLWQAVNGINNPCPSGYRLPTSTELNEEGLSWSLNNNATGAFASPLKLPMAGFRSFSSGSVIFPGKVGMYWSSTVSVDSYFILNFGSTSTTMSVSSPATGRSVRCLKD